MTGEVRFVPDTRQEEDLAMAEEADIDFGPDDFKEMGAPTSSVFDVDVQFQQDVRPQQSTSKTSVAMAVLQKKAQAKRKERSASSQQPQATVIGQISTSTSPPGVAVQSISAKRAGKLPVGAVSGLPMAQQPEQSTSTTTQQTASGTSESSTSEPDYLGLYQMLEDSLSDSTFSSRIGRTAIATSGFVGVAATGTMEMPGEEDTDEEESQVLFSALKRSRTRDSLSTTDSSKQYKKKRTAMILKQLQKRSKK
ncbi:6-phosphofructo-2-kinase [Mucor velutinosus]|uniref:6-phosphofructo-2-kinase n=1 Tax=Mucor velutinosus TaxID=708070 RepID=A0AAN7DMF2_9FUNG|nr:6-phosphofructo-2-kinase [Mucor velutinosus]